MTRPGNSKRRLDEHVRGMLRRNKSAHVAAPERSERLLAGAPLEPDAQWLRGAYVWAAVELLRTREALRPVAEFWDATRARIIKATLRRPARKLKSDPDRTTHDVRPRLRKTSDFAHKLTSLRRRAERLYRLKRRLAEALYAEDQRALEAEAAEVAVRHAEAAALKAERDRAARTRRRELKLRKIDSVRGLKARLSQVLAALRYERRIAAADPRLIAALERRRDNLLEKTLRRSRD